MISKRTVLILGAASSSHVGYPLGISLVNQICQRIKGKQYAQEIKDKIPPDQIDLFRRCLSRSGHHSIDAFLEQYREHSDLGRLFIVDTLKQYEDEDRLFSPNDPGWYSNLFDALITPSINDFADAPITIITFNYDRSLEAFLHQSIQYRYNISSDDALKVLKRIPIIHPHGILGEYPDVPYQTKLDGHSLSDIADKISIIYELHDAPNDFCNDEFRKGHDALQKAERIVFLGFGFHEDNVRRFQFFSKEALEGKEIGGTLYIPAILDKTMTDLLAKYGIERNNLASYGIDIRYCFNNYFAF